MVAQRENSVSCSHSVLTIVCIAEPALSYCLWATCPCGLLMKGMLHPNSFADVNKEPEIDTESKMNMCGDPQQVRMQMHEFVQFSSFTLYCIKITK